MERSYSAKCKSLCHRNEKNGSFQNLIQRYKDMNLTDWDELNSIDLSSGLIFRHFTFNLSRMTGVLTIKLIRKYFVLLYDAVYTVL